MNGTLQEGALVVNEQKTNHERASIPIVNSIDNQPELRPHGSVKAPCQLETPVDAFITALISANTRPTAEELAEHYAWNGPLARWVIERLAEDDPQRLADEDYCANHCAHERREWEDCSLVGGCPLLRTK